MNPQPSRAFVFPLITQTRRNGISQTKRHEVHAASLLPVRETISRMPNSGIRIEELQFRHVTAVLEKNLSANNSESRKEQGAAVSGPPE
jgi:hypothetical protein